MNRWPVPLGVLVAVPLGLFWLESRPAASQASRPPIWAGPSCNQAALAKGEATFRHLAALQRFRPGSITDHELHEASIAYVLAAEACVAEKAAPSGIQIDDGPLTMTDAGSQGVAAPYVLFGTKWGAGSPFGAGGRDNDGPRIPGGTVTYSYMGDGLDMTGDLGTPGPSVSLASLPTYQPCFRTEIATAFAAWAAVADIQFAEVADNAAPFNADGAVGDIRIAAHTFSSTSPTSPSSLAHAYMPPPQGLSAAGDIHFNRETPWSCTSDAGVLDIGVVALHEIGHALGLLHESGRATVMVSNYQPFTSIPLADDIDAATTIYGSLTGGGDDLLINFGPDHGVWLLDYGAGWRQIHTRSPELTAVGDLNGNGRDDLVFDFGVNHGLWLNQDANQEASSWRRLDARSPTRLAVADVDHDDRGNVIAFFESSGLTAFFASDPPRVFHHLPPTAMAWRRDGSSNQLVASLPGIGVWRAHVHSGGHDWTYVHNVEANAIVFGNFDTAADPDDTVFGFPGVGLYQYSNSVSWSQLHSTAPTRIEGGDLDVGDLRDDLVLDFDALGLWTLTNGNSWAKLHDLPSKAIAVGDLDGSGLDEIAVAFDAPHGLWLLVNGITWVRLHQLSPVDLHVVDVN